MVCCGVLCHVVRCGIYTVGTSSHIKIPNKHGIKSKVLKPTDLYVRRSRGQQRDKWATQNKALPHKARHLSFPPAENSRRSTATPEKEEVVTSRARSTKSSRRACVYRHKPCKAHSPVILRFFVSGTRDLAERLRQTKQKSECGQEKICRKRLLLER